MDLDGLAKIKREWMPNDGMLTLGIYSRNVGSDPNLLRGNIPVEIARKEWGAARALGLPITLHTSGPSPITLLERSQASWADVQLVHPLLTTAEERRILKERGVSYSTSPDRRIAASGERRRHPVRGAARGRRESQHVDRQYQQLQPATISRACACSTPAPASRRREPPLTAKRLVQLATLDGAVDLGIADRTGSLTPGKRADIILVRAGDINIAPAGTPMKRSSGSRSRATWIR